MALTGARLQAADLIATGLATHYISSQKIDDLEAALVGATKNDDTAIQHVLDEFHETPNDMNSDLDQNHIDETFHPIPESIEMLMERLENASDTEFGQKTLATLRKMSPTSLKVTLEGLKRGNNHCRDIGEDLAMEFRMAQAFMRPGSDFYEGIRAVLVDKDHTFRWNPSSLSEVEPIAVEQYFSPIKVEWTVPKLAGSRSPISKL